jgi:hypothetical protein
MVTVLSWDVGIINLAYCLIHKDGENFEIKKWGIISLSDNTKFCQFITNKNMKCGKTAKFETTHKTKNKFNEYCQNNETSFYTCIAHKEKFNPEIIKCYGSTIKCDKCKNMCSYIVNGCDYGWCDDHYEKSKIKFLKELKIKKVCGTSCTKQLPQITATKLFEILDTHTEFLNVDEILIENQPAMKNPQMKSIASYLFSYFVIRGIIDKQNNTSNIKNIKQICPSNKLKVNKTETDNVLKNDKNNEKIYKLTKKLGIKYCSALVTTENNNFLKTFKKKDDLCDAFLQGFYYLFNPVPLIYFEKLNIVGFDTTEKETKKVKDIKDIKDNIKIET